MSILECCFKNFSSIEVLNCHSPSSKTVKVHFDRKADRVLAKQMSSHNSATESPNLRVVSHGAWSIKGQRKTQEDAFGENPVNILYL